MNRKTSVLTTFVLAAGALAASAMGCELLAKVDRNLIGTGGTGGSGTTSSTTTSTGGGCTAATVATDCPKPGSECVIATCDMGVCGTGNVMDGTLVTAQTMGDCKKVVCDGSGSTKSIGDDTDLPDDGNACTTDACSNGTPSHTPVAPTTSGQCTVGGKAGFCGNPAGSAAGTCVECNVGADCTTKVCQSNACKPQSCADQVQNGDETDVDCGGSCGSCADDEKCLVPGDCKSSVCDGTAKTCTPATCSDGVQNESESDKDCGHVCTPTKLCGSGQKCVDATDCQSGVCDTTAKTCTAPSCSDGVKNQGESGVDCGGTSGCNPCANGKTCAAKADCASGFCDTTASPSVCAACATDPQCQPGAFCKAGTCAATQGDGTMCTGGNGNQCTSGFCADGVCCDKACSGTCVACTATLKGTGADGVCGSIAAGTDPKGQCSPATCNGTQLSAATTCNGSATTPACTTASPVQCAPFICQTTGCTTTCTTAGTDCAPGDFCYVTGGGVGTKTCHADQCSDGAADGSETDVDCGGATCGKCANGKTCSAGTDCTGTFCYVTGGGAGTKTCHANQCSDGAADGSETDVDCGGSCSTCATGKKCSTAGDCASGICYVTGGGAGQKTCQANLCNDGAKDTGETDVDCGGATCGKCANGKQCSTSGDCTSTFCYVTGGGAGTSTCHANQCSDGAADGSESDVDCGGLVCGPTCAYSKACTTGTDCVSGVCNATNTCGCASSGDCPGLQSCDLGTNTCS